MYVGSYNNKVLIINKFAYIFNFNLGNTLHW